ncbi:hypothetical protein C1I98_19395, partial [Spongiactinospora gelatinilytica]
MLALDELRALLEDAQREGVLNLPARALGPWWEPVSGLWAGDGLRVERLDGGDPARLSVRGFAAPAERGATPAAVSLEFGALDGEVAGVFLTVDGIEPGMPAAWVA